MYDQETARLIRETPSLKGLNRKSLPLLLTEAFAEIASARIRLRDMNNEEPQRLSKLLRKIRRLAYTNEALVSALPDREDRSAAAFVAATAHQLCLDADHILGRAEQKTFINAYSISSDIAAMLLYMIAEATADASEISKKVNCKSSDSFESELIISLRDLACGKLTVIVNRIIPDIKLDGSEDLATLAVNSLYRVILEGVRALANQILGQSEHNARDPVSIFKEVCKLCIGPNQEVFENTERAPTSVFSGPFHLASLLISVSKDLANSSIVNINVPPKINKKKWNESMRHIAKYRPYLWRNHRDAIQQGYLRIGVSAVVGFPTGAGKSTLSELKINTALLSKKSVLFLAPTHALVDQTSKSLSYSFPGTPVQREQLDEFYFSTDNGDIPEIFVMTPESCLAQMSMDSNVFTNVGLFVFDECHLLHPNDNLNDRRAIDAMLCVLNLSKIAPDMDFLLLSAMVKNTDDLARWISELTGRPCLPLSLSWKPTRQLRRSVVYDQEIITRLNRKLSDEKVKSSTRSPPVAIKRTLNVKAKALFSMKQTWATRNRNEYVLVGLLEESVQLAANSHWRLTPNAISVSSSIAAAATKKNIKTLVFFQSIKNAVSAANQISKLLPPISIKLRNDEAGWLDTAITELGGEAHLYLDVKNGRVVKPATAHHGLLLPEERFLCESLYKRSDGLKVLTATSTLAQGMNLPSELVIIGEDSRFDKTTDKREILQAQELLNAAGRAGRAGESSNGIVLVVPGKVVGIDIEEATIGAHWSDLREIFGQSDQCLEIEDPLSVILDQIHVESDSNGELERYAILRLSSIDGENQSEALVDSIKSSFGAYLARKKGNDSWVQERVNTATAFLKVQSPESKTEIVESQVAASLGLSLNLVSRLSDALKKNPLDSDAKIPEWRRWFFNWLSLNPDLLEQVIRRQSLIELFGKKYESLNSAEEQAQFAIPILRKLVWYWMRGDTLSEMELLLGTERNKLKTCDKARRFVLKIIPELSYLFGLPALLHRRFNASTEQSAYLSPALFQLGRCIRIGLNSHEKAALNNLLQNLKLSRRQIHQHFARAKHYLERPKPRETWSQTLQRVRVAINKELNDQDI